MKHMEECKGLDYEYCKEIEGQDTVSIMVQDCCISMTNKALE